MRVRAVHRACARARATCGRPGPGCCAWTTSSSPTSSGPRSRSRSAWPSSWSARSPAGSSRSTRARPARPSPSCYLEAWNELVAANPILADLEPEVEALVVNRLVDPHGFAIVPIDRCYELVGMIKATLGGDLGRRRRAERGRGVLRAPAAEQERRVSGEPEAVAAGADRPGVPGARRRVGARRGGPDAVVRPRRDRELGPRGVHDRAHGADQHRSGPSQLRRRDRAALVELFGAPERWAATTKSFLWSQVSTLVPSFTGETTFTMPVPCTYDLELAAAKYLYSVPDGEVPVAFHFTGSVLYARRRRRSCRSCSSRGRARPTGACPWPRGAR